MAELMEQLSTIRTSEIELLEVVAALDPNAHATLSVVPPSSAQIQGALGAGEVLLLSYDLEEQIIVLAVSAQEQFVFTLPAPELIAVEVASLWDQYGGRRVGLADRRELKAHLASLSERILRPVSPLLETAKTIFWSPDPALSSLPLAALPLNELALSDRAEIVGIQSLRTLFRQGGQGSPANFSSLKILADPAQPGAGSSSDLSSLRRQLRGLRRGELAAMLEEPHQDSRTALLVLPPRLSAAHRLSYLSMNEGPSLSSLRSAERGDRFLRVLGDELEKGESLSQAMKAARAAARRKRSDPLGWAALTLWFD